MGAAPPPLLPVAQVGAAVSDHLAALGSILSFVRIAEGDLMSCMKIERIDYSEGEGIEIADLVWGQH